VCRGGEDPVAGPWQGNDRQGGVLPDEMLAAAQTLRDAVSRAEAPPVEDELDADGKKKEPVVALGQRAWPLIDMLERTAKGSAKANIVWEASAAF
ncbi:MAG: DUF1840 family protein, partial [Betaproteobacteria bacterium]|nr:DUF1840 family protein [Betaproteobacteria bacterium]